ncbi:MAG: sodium:calcium antiporter [Candidatus Micrarchaeota archaeon]
MSEWLIPLLYVLGGLIVVLWSAEKSTKHAAELARIFGISELAIGFILLSIATSLPEFVISATAAFKGGTDLSVGNVFGANIADVTLVLGVAAILGVVAIKRKDLDQLVMIMLATSLISLFFVIYEPGRLTGAALFLIFLAYVYWMLSKGKKKGAPIKEPQKRVFLPHLTKFIFFIAIVLLMAQIVVDNSIRLSNILGIAETVIGGTLISLGTTFPELSVSIAAARQKKEKMAIGNAVGSAIVNLTMIFGVALMINPAISFAPALKLIIFSVIANMVLLYLVIVRKGIDKKAGMALVLGYLAFLVIFGAGSI